MSSVLSWEPKAPAERCRGLSMLPVFVAVSKPFTSVGLWPRCTASFPLVVLLSLVHKERHCAPLRQLAAPLNQRDHRRILRDDQVHDCDAVGELGLMKWDTDDVD